MSKFKYHMLSLYIVKESADKNLYKGILIRNNFSAFLHADLNDKLG